jgi:membrane-associated protease RseP (regulator of RpoE activity)
MTDDSSDPRLSLQIADDRRTSDLSLLRPELAWPRSRRNVLLFVLTLLSVFYTGALTFHPELSESGGLPRLSEIWRGWSFAVPLLAILLAHEFGHYIAARLHRVPASLPYFIPLPILSPFGTLGAVIAMPERIRSRNALLDVGAAGPLAGMVVALPVLAIGLHLSPLGPNGGSGYVQEGQSLLYALMKWLVVGPIPAGWDVHLHPTAMAGWAGFLITMINLLPWGQLDGGHIAFALFGDAQHTYARWFRRALLLLFAMNLVKFIAPVAMHHSSMGYLDAVMNSLFWLMWFLVTGLIGRLSGGADHPPFEPSALTPGRRAVAWLSLALFVALFMPTPWAKY